MASPFHSLYSHDFVRIAACVPRIQVAGVAANLAETIRAAREGNALSTALMVFPELGLSAYAIDDLLLQDALLDAYEQVRSRIEAALNIDAPEVGHLIDRVANEVDRLVDDRLGDRDLAEQQRVRIAEAAHGVPLFVEQLVAMMDAGELAEEGEMYVYFNNDWEGFAPRNALTLRGLIE